MNDILDLVPLSFDPKASNDPKIRKIFLNDMARTLWLGVRQGHAATETFKDDILCCAEALENLKERGELDADSLFRILSGFPMPLPLSHGVIGPNEKPFAEKLLPFVLGKRAIHYQIVKPK